MAVPLSADLKEVYEVGDKPLSDQVGRTAKLLRRQRVRETDRERERERERALDVEGERGEGGRYWKK